MATISNPQQFSAFRQSGQTLDQARKQTQPGVTVAPGQTPPGRITQTIASPQNIATLPSVPFRVEAPQTFDFNQLSEAVTKPVTQLDLQAKYRDINTQRQQLLDQQLAAMQPSELLTRATQRLGELQTQQAELQQATAQGLRGAGREADRLYLTQPFAAGAASQAQQNILESADIESGILAREAATQQNIVNQEVALQNNLLQRIQAQQDFTTQDYQDFLQLNNSIEQQTQNVLNRFEKLFSINNQQRTQAAQTLATLTQAARGITFEELDAQSQQELINAAAAAGIPADLLINAVNTETAAFKQENLTKQFEMLRAQKGLMQRDTQIIELPNGQKALVDIQTGEQLKTYGEILSGLLDGAIPPAEAAEIIMGGQSGMSLDDLPTKNGYRAAVASELSKKKEEALASGDIYGIIAASAGGKDVSDTFIQSFEKSSNVLSQIGELQKAIEGEVLDPILGIIRSNNPYDKKAQLIKAQLTSIVPNLARGVYGEVGVLTDNDIKIYSQTLPNLRSTEDVAKLLLGATVRTVQRSLENKIRTQAGFGRDVSGIADQYRAISELAESLLPTEQQPAAQNYLISQAQQLYGNSIKSGLESGGTPQQAIDYILRGPNSEVKDRVNKAIQNGAEPEQILEFYFPGSTGGGFNSVGGDTQPAVTGELSQQFESSGNPGAIGYDTVGGTSYGKYQMIPGRVETFLKAFPAIGTLFQGLKIGTSAFNAKWKQVASEKPKEFANAQQEFIVRSHYQPQVEKLKQSGFEISKYSPALREVIFSTAVQHGPNNNIIVRAINKVGKNASEEDIIREVYNQRWSGGQEFKSSTPEVKKAVYNRFFGKNGELNKALSMLG